MNSLLSRDPGTFLASFATWAILLGISLLMPGDIFVRAPVYSELARLGFDDTGWGCAMVVDGLLLGITVGWGKAGWRALIAISSAPFWFGFGALMMAGAWQAGFLSAVGAYNMLAAIYLSAAGAQWVHTLDRAPQGPGTAAATEFLLCSDSQATSQRGTGEGGPWT